LVSERLFLVKGFLFSHVRFLVKITAAEEFFETQQRLINDLLKRHDPRLAPIPNNTSPLVMNITLIYPKLLELVRIH
jgi:hypothetical protein